VHDIQARAQPDYSPAPLPNQPLLPRGPYASWDDFRSNSPAVQRALTELATRALPDLRGVELRPVPERVPDTDEDLGCPIASVTLAGNDRPGGLVNVQQILYGGICCAALVLVALLAQSSHAYAAIAVFAGMCGLLAAVWWASWRGPFQARAWHANLSGPFQSLRLWVFDDGILWQDGANFGRCRWEDIAEFQATGDSCQPRFRIVPRRDLEMILSLSASPAVLALAEYIETKITSAQLLPQLQHIVAGGRARFGSVTLDRRGFASPGFAAAWSQIVRVMADRCNAFVECRGQPTWHQIRYADVSRALLMFAIAQVLIEEDSQLPPLG
jgi:hypothetical protein